MMPQVTRPGEILNSRMSGGIVKRATVAVWLSVFALLTLGLSGCGSSSSTPQAIGVGLTPSGSKSIDQAQTVPITAAVSNDSKSAGVTWTVSGTNGSQGTLTNTSTSSATYNTPASVTSAFTATVTATSVTDTTKFAVLKINVSPLPSITTTSLVAATAGTAYSATLVEAGGTSPYTWTVTPATLPAGLSLNSSTGVISGMPTGGGSGNFTFKVTDAAGASVSSPAITLTVAAPPALTVTTASLAAGMMGTAYSQTLQATGGIPPYTWSVPPGTLPAGLTLNSSTGVISGMPTGLVTGTIGFTVTVTDVQTPTHASTPAALSIAVSAPTLSATTSSLPGGTMGNLYSQTQLTAKGGVGADTWKLASGSSLPAGLNLSTGGVITGTPSGNFVGTTKFTVIVTDSETPTPQTATAGLSIAITVAPLSVTTTSSSLPVGVAFAPYNATLSATGGIQPYTWSISGNPPWLSINPSTGVLSGTPTRTTPGFTVTVTDSETPTGMAATANLIITVNPALSVYTTSLPAGVVGTSYPAGTALQATGGVSPYTWAVTLGSLPAGLSLNASTGAITGKPTGPAVGTIGFTVTVTDSESPTKMTATQSLSIVITAPQLTVTTTMASLPTGVIGNSYPGTLQASGGVPSYSWSLTGGSLPTGLTLNSNGTFSGAPTVTGTFPFTVQVTDSETPTPQIAPASLSISVNNSAPLGVTTTSSQLPAGLTGTAYPSTTLLAIGGVQPYSWSYTGSLPTSLSLSPSGVITGTPTVAGTFNFTVKVTDSTKPNPGSATANLSITVSTPTPLSLPPSGPLVTAIINQGYTGAINASGGVGPNYTFTVNSAAVPTSGTAVPLGNGTLAVSNTGGNTLSISGTPNTLGTVSFTVSVTDGAPTTVGPNTYTIAVINPAAVYTVSGTVSYGGSQTGWTYLQLYSNNCGGCNNNLGTSISEATLKAGGAFTIHGVQPGTYTLQAYMDNLGYGAENASNPTGSVGNVTVTNVGVSVGSVALSDPGTVTLNSAPTWKSNNGSGAFSGGAFVSFQTIQNSNGIEMATSYTVEWSTSATFATVTGSKSFTATGRNNPWIVTGLPNGAIYYFRAQGVAGSSISNWSAASSAMTIGAPTGGNTVSGQVTFSETAKGPLYVGFYDQNTNNIYATVVGSKATPPTSPASYSVQVPTGSDYFFFGIIDQNNTGLISGPGEISNTDQNNKAPVAINPSIPSTLTQDLTLPSASSVATVMTQNSEQINSGVTNSNYSIGFQIYGLLKLPVAVELATESSPGVVIPADIANGGFNGNKGFNFWTGLNGATPNKGDSYGLKVTYSDGTSETLTATVSAVLDAFATNLSPQGNGVSLTPNFSWSDLFANPSNYTYQFWLCCSNNNNGNNTIWQIPGNNSNSNGFSSSITSLTWGIDPTNSGNTPSVSSLSGSTNYSWQIAASDINGNSAQVQVSFETLETQLSLLPAGGALSSGTVEQGYNASISASGGSGSGYVFTLNGSLPPGLSYGTNNNSLNISGAPNTPGNYPFTVQVTDSESHIAGPYTYTITVDNYAPVSLPAASSNPLGSALVGTSYGGTINASGGAGGGNYSFTVNGTTVPTNMTYVSVANGDGLTVANSGGNTLSFAGTPTTVETVSLAVTVIDTTNSSDTASVTYTLPVVAGPNGANNGNLKGTYVCKIDGFNDSDGSRWASLGSFQAGGNGIVSNGVWDMNSRNQTTEASGTLSGTYSIGSDNNGLATITAVQTSGGSGTHTSQFAVALTNAVEPAQQFRMVETDDIGSSPSGQHSTANCYLATTSAFAASTFSGNSFAFGMNGEDGSGNPKLTVGRFSALSGNLSTGDVDQAAAGSSVTNTAFTGSYTTPNATTGRSTFTFVPTSGGGSLTLVVYIIDADRMFMIDTSEKKAQAGDMRKQMQTTYSGANLNAPFVLYTQGYEYSNGSVSGYLSMVLQGRGNGAGNFTVNQSYNDSNGTYQVGQENGGPIALTFDSSYPGRATFSTGGSGTGYLYFFNNNTAFEMDSDSGDEPDSGWMEAQSQTTFTDAALAGSYMTGKLPATSQGENDNIGEVIFASSGAITGSQTQAGEGKFEWEAPLPPDLTYSWLSATDGTFSVLSSGVAQLSCAVISSTKLVCIENSSNSANVTIMQQ